MSQVLCAVSLAAISVFLFVLPWFSRGLYGLDWTDTTYHFQQALNVVDGARPNRDFDSHVPGLSFILEAEILRIFGSHFFTHRALGLLTPFLIVLSVTLVVLSIRDRTSGSGSLLLSLMLAAAVSATFWGQQLYFSFTAIGGALSFLVGAFIFWAINAHSERLAAIHLFIASLVLGFVFLIKQSHGTAAFLLATVTILARPFLEAQQRSLGGCLVRAISGGAILTLGSLFSALTGATLICGGACIADLHTFVGGGLELKGLSLAQPFAIISTVIGVATFEHAISFLLVAIIVVQGVALFWYSGAFRVATLVAIFFLPLLVYEFAVKRGLDAILVLAHFSTISLMICLSGMIVLKAIMPQVLPNSRGDSFRQAVALTGFSAPVLGIIFAEQLSWPGPSHIRTYLTLPYLLIAPLIACKIFGLDASLLQARSRVPLIVIIFFSGISVFWIEQMPRRFADKEIGLVPLGAPATFEGWPVAPRTKGVVETLRAKARHCPGDELFQIHWSPILYEVTGRRNSTSFDLPYQDTLSVSEARQLIDELEENVPGMLIIDPRAREYTGPFPALGMHAVVEYLDEQLLQAYRLNARVADGFKTFEIYCRISDASPPPN